MGSYDNKVQNKKNKNIISSFKYGFLGLFEAIKRERNIKIALVLIVLGSIISCFLNLSMIEWIIVILMSVIVVSLEMMNTALEAVVDMAMPNIHPLAKLAKDTAAGAVVLSVVVAFIVGVIIYLPKLIALF